MMRKSVRSIAAWAIFLFLWGCGETPQPAPAPAPQRVKAPAPAQDLPEPSELQEDQAPPQPAYVYEPAGRRDPFEPLVLIKKPVEKANVPLTPLQTFDISQLRLIGIIVGKGTPRAMVTAPDGKAYILKNGVKVGKNDGAVVAIRNDRVLVEEKFYDFSGEIRTATQEITLPEREGVL